MSNSEPVVVAEAVQPTSSAQPPNPIIINQYYGRGAKWLAIIGWSAFLVCYLLYVSGKSSQSDYYDNSGGLEEKYHSGSRDAQGKIAIISISGTIADGASVKTQIDRVREDAS